MLVCTLTHVGVSFVVVCLAAVVLTLVHRLCMEP